MIVLLIRYSNDNNEYQGKKAKARISQSAFIMIKNIYQSIRMLFKGRLTKLTKSLYTKAR